MTPLRGAAKAIVEKQLAQRELLWPGAEPGLWHRKANKGFATIPKTMPLILQIMDDLSNGKPLSATYLGLWCETRDNSMVNVSKHGCGQLLMYRYFRNSILIDLLPELFPPGFRERERTQA
jgi:hypothetical protein